ncbi:protein MKS1 [Senna tora]|uniref:Protein MKS1 n=1 Tax=Senna tora TaxID=362788 RepID=A0A834WX72_9FABA|nr:protein MKS1 [Senna tora]
MNPPGFPSGERTPPSSRELQLQGPRPSPLSVSKDSHKIRKPPLPPHAGYAAGGFRQHQQQQDPPQPLIIYSVSPKAINVPVDDFMKVVQRLTGASSSPSRSGDVSPAARLASIEKTSPTEKERFQSGDEMMMSMLDGVEVSQFHGILSPAPATLPTISSDLFSPAMDQETLSWLHELSPFWSANSFLPSPSGLFSTSIVSPIPSPDVFRIFD